MFNLYTLLITTLLFVLRCYYILNIASKRRTKRTKPARTLVVLGSGGHTTEMMTILKHLSKVNYSPRNYVMSDIDTTSETKVLTMEEPATSSKDYHIFRIKRSRNVGQNYISSVFTTMISTWLSIPLVYKLQPDLVISNGPGTCFPICFISFIFRVFGLLDSGSKIVFVESFCRVRTISLTGRILIWFVDTFVVQWPEILKISSGVKYFGRIT